MAKPDHTIDRYKQGGHLTEVRPTANDALLAAPAPLDKRDNGFRISQIPQSWKGAMTDPGRRMLLQFALWAPLAAPLLAHAEDTQAAVLAPVATLNSGLIAVMKLGKSKPFAKRYDILAPAVDSTFDLADILRRCTSPRWATLSAREQTNLLEVFRRFTVTSYVASFDHYSGEIFEISPLPRNVGEQMVVETHVVPAIGERLRIDYVMRRQDNTWQAVDVLINGSISRVAVQRSDFRHWISGRDVSELVSSMQQKIISLSDGSLRS